VPERTVLRYCIAATTNIYTYRWTAPWNTASEQSGANWVKIDSSILQLLLTSESSSSFNNFIHNCCVSVFRELRRLCNYSGTDIKKKKIEKE
jgi:hypothetical protein